VQKSAAVPLPDYEEIETSAAPVILPGPTTSKLMPQPQLQYCRLHRHFSADKKQCRHEYMKKRLKYLVDTYLYHQLSHVIGFCKFNSIAATFMSNLK